MVIEFNTRISELQRLTAERDYVQGQYEEVVATKSALETQVAFGNSDAAVEKWAYEEGHLVRPGDVPVVPIQSTAVTPIATPSPMVIETEQSNLDYWLALFFGPKSP